MKRKAIEAIPFMDVQTDGNHKYTAGAQLIEIKGVANLIVDVFKAGAAVYRMAFTEKDWAMYDPATENWSKCNIADDYGGMRWREIGANEAKEVQRPYLAEEQQDLVWETCEKWHGKSYLTKQYYSWIQRLQALTDDITFMQKNRRTENRRLRLKEREDNTPELPQDLEQWADSSMFFGTHFLYYKRHGRYVDIACSSCGRVRTVATKRTDSWEGQFETVIQAPKNNDRGICPSCGASGTWKAQGKTRGVYGMKKSCFVGMPYKEKGAVIRYLEIEKCFRLDELAEGKELVMMEASESYIVNEISRAYFEPGKKKVQRDFHKWDGYIGQNFWDDCNLDGMNNIKIREGAVYPKTWELLEGTMLQYTGAKEFAHMVREFNLMDYMERYTQYKQIEFMSKMGLSKLVTEMVKCRLGFIANQYGKTPADFLGINKNRVKQLVAEQGDTDLLEAMQIEHRQEAHWKDYELQFVRMLKKQKNGLYRALQYQTVQKLANKLAIWTGVEFVGDICSSEAQRLENIANLYFDYLNMREQRGYDLTNTVYLWPHDLQHAHDQMVMEINAHEIEAREKQVADKYPGIRKNYRKLREKYFYEDDTYVIRPARSAEEIVREGRILHHCVGGDTYLSKHNTDISHILFLRFKETPETPYITIEVRGNGIVQWYGAYDKKPDQKNIDRWLSRYIRMLNDGTMRWTDESAMQYADMPLMAAAM